MHGEIVPPDPIDHRPAAAAPGPQPGGEPPGRRGTFTVAAAVVAVAALLLAGCGGDDGDDASPASTTTTESTTAPTSTSTTTTTEPRPVEEEVEEAYWEAVAVLDDVLQDPNPRDERLARVLADPLLTHVTGYVGDLEDEGVATQWVDGDPPPREVRSIDVAEGLAKVVVCEIDNPHTIDLDTGEVLDDSVTSAVVEAEVRRTSTGWVLSDLASTSEWNDGLGCDR